MTTAEETREEKIQREIRDKVADGLNCLSPPETVIAYQQLVDDGKDIFFKRMAKSHGIDVSYFLMMDVKALLEYVRQSKRATSDIQLCRLLGYLEAMTTLCGRLPMIQGVTISYEDRQFSMTIDQSADGKAAANEADEHSSEDFSHLDTLDGPALEDALGKMTPAERARYLKAS
jgi:hypothetical protein